MKEYVVAMEKFNEKSKNMVFKEGKKQVLLIEVNKNNIMGNSFFICNIFSNKTICF